MNKHLEVKAFHYAGREGSLTSDSGVGAEILCDKIRQSVCGEHPMARRKAGNQSAALRYLLRRWGQQRQVRTVFSSIRTPLMRVYCIMVNRLIGFEELGNSDGFETAALELRLQMSGACSFSMALKTHTERIQVYLSNPKSHSAPHTHLHRAIESEVKRGTMIQIRTRCCQMRNSIWKRAPNRSTIGNVDRRANEQRQ